MPLYSTLPSEVADSGVERRHIHLHWHEMTKDYRPVEEYEKRGAVTLTTFQTIRTLKM